MPGHIFSIANLVVIAGWLSLAVFPRQRWARIVSAGVVPGLLAAAYVVIVASVWGESEGGFSSLADVARLFQNPWMLLAGWLHYLAFDLLVGNWIVRDARAHGIAHGWVLPLLLLTFLFGPSGWLAYLGVRAIKGQPVGATPIEAAT